MEKPMSDKPAIYYAWFDCETTGSTASDVVLEVALVITDSHFNTLWQTYDLIDADLNAPGISLPEIVADMHNDSGLWYDWKNPANFKFPSCRDWDAYAVKNIQRVFDKAKYWLPNGFELKLAGSGVSHFDSLIIKRDMPYLWNLLKGFEGSDMLKPTADVGVIRRFYQDLNLGPFPNTFEECNFTVPKSQVDTMVPHRAMYDVLLSIAQVQWFEYQIKGPE